MGSAFKHLADTSFPQLTARLDLQNVLAVEHGRHALCGQQLLPGRAVGQLRHGVAVGAGPARLADASVERQGTRWKSATTATKARGGNVVHVMRQKRFFGWNTDKIVWVGHQAANRPASPAVTHSHTAQAGSRQWMEIVERGICEKEAPKIFRWGKRTVLPEKDRRPSGRVPLPPVLRADAPPVPPSSLGLVSVRRRPESRP